MMGKIVELPAITVKSCANNPLEVTGEIETAEESVDTPTTENIACASNAVTYDYTLPAGSKRFVMLARGKSRIEININTDLTTKHVTVEPGASYEESRLRRTGTYKLYFRCSKDNETIEVISWV